MRGAYAQLHFELAHYLRFIPTCVGHTTGAHDRQSRFSVHPHMRGAYAYADRPHCYFSGSSPHAWGIRLISVRLQSSTRFIPTCVGHTLTAISASMDLTVHPHMRGAYCSTNGFLRLLTGSSPHAWGIRLISVRLQSSTRFIPTCVGHTLTAISASMDLTVHPHMRGAYCSTNGFLRLLTGSSPHAWGIPCHRLTELPLVRFIPTCVGHTNGFLSFISVEPVHPHMRGAYLHKQPDIAVTIGSSPHAWGILHRCNNRIPCNRFIPTCVGHTHATLNQVLTMFGSSPHAWGIRPYCLERQHILRFIPTCVGHTFLSICQPDAVTVHPHMRGAYELICSPALICCGSSPHAWGIQGGNQNEKDGLRFIPTCVGHTIPITTFALPGSVHPHMRGAYFSYPPCLFLASGSSPHAWGIRFLGAFCCIGVRFIPTCVGHTILAASLLTLVTVHPHMRGAYAL